MGFDETEPAGHEPAPPAPPPPPVDPAKPRRGRPPLDPARREEKAKREVVRRLAAKAVEAKTEDEFFRRVERLKAERDAERAGRPAPAPAATGEVFTSKEKTPAELEAERRAAGLEKIAHARAELLALLGVAEEAMGVEKGKLVPPMRANVAATLAAPWFSNNPPGTELSPRAQKVGLFLGVAVLFGPAVVRLAREHGPKVAQWWREREQQRKAAAAP